MTSNVTKYLQYPRITLTFFGIWPREHRTTLSEAYAIFIVCIQNLFLFFNGAYVYMMRGDLQAMSDASYIFFTQLALCFRAAGFYLARDSLKKALVMMDDDVFQAEDANQERKIKKYSKNCKTLYKFLIGGFLSTVTAWNVVALRSEERKYPYNEIWFPVDIEASPQYQIAYVYEVMTMFMSAFLFLSMDTVTVATIIFTCAQLELLEEKSKKIKSLPWTLKISQKERQEQVENNNKLLVDCIKHHQAITRFLNQIQDTFSYPVFIQLCFTALIICVIGFRMIQDSPANASFYGILNYFVLILAQIYLYCWCGNELTERSEAFRKCLYEVPWYEQDAKFTRTLWIALQCTKKPLVFRIGGYVTLARATFVSLLRCSYSYFAVIRQANE